MSTYDVRSNNEEVITEIVFADCQDSNDFSQAYRIFPDVVTHTKQKYIVISEDIDSVIINSKEHDLNLIEALNKAIELGWIE